MRSILAFLLTAFVCAAQTLNEIERLEKKIADHPDSVPDRMALLGNLTNRAVSLAPGQVREARRRNVLWLIEHHPEAAIYDAPTVLIPVRGRLADPVGAAEVMALWTEITAKPSAKSEVIANAAIYLRAVDIAAALAILNAHADDPVLSRARGFVDAAAILGLSGLSEYSQFRSQSSLRSSPEAKAARREIDSSANPHLLGGAGQAFAQAGIIEIPNDLTFDSDDVPTLGERWLRRAIELAPPGLEWKNALGQELWHRATRTTDPNEKVRLFRESLSKVADAANPDILSNLIVAEFDAGDDAAAERDAQELLTSAPKIARTYNLAQTILGCVAAAKGDLKGAERRLMASITMPDTIKNAALEPNMTLAQDVYDAGDRDAVVQFLEASRTLWKFDRGRIDRMISFVKKASSVDLVQLSRQFPGSEVIRRAAPAFEAADADGKMWTREQLTGKVAALEFGKAPLAEKVAKDFASRGVILLQVQDEDTKRRFEVLTDPTLVIVDRKGNVSAFRSGPANETEWRTDFESGFGSAAVPSSLPFPRQIETAGGSAKVNLSWEPVDNAASYVVEWDSRDEKGWIFDRDKTVRVIPTRETSAMLDLTGFTRVRWRVYAVPAQGQPGIASPWRELEGTPFTKIYK